MKQIKTIERNILDTLMKIHLEFPELNKYIAEMPKNYLGINKQEISVKNLKEDYHALELLIVKYTKTYEAIPHRIQNENGDFLGYPLYPPTDDIYVKGIEESELNPEDISKLKAPNDDNNTPNEKGFKNHMSGDDLDIPGSELDDQQESVGSEDEENNYYSLGGDNHDDLEEDNC